MTAGGAFFRRGPSSALLVSLGCLFAAATPQHARAGAEVETAPTPKEAKPGSPNEPSSKTIAILILMESGIEAQLSDLYDAARRSVEKNTPFSPVLFESIALSPEKELRECAGDAQCFARKIRDHAGNVSYLLTIAIRRLDQGVLFGLRMVDVETGRDLGVSGDEVGPEVPISRGMEAQLPTVFPPAFWGQIADLQVETDPANAEVSVSGRSCASPCNIARLNKGVHEVLVKKPGFAQWRQQVSLEPQKTTKIHAQLEPIETGGLIESPIFWAAVAVGVAGAATLSYFLLRNTDTGVDVCLAREPGPCEN